MGYAELIQQRLQNLPMEKQAEVYDFVEFLVGRVDRNPIDDSQRRADVTATLRAARAAWPGVPSAQLDQQLADMRNEWDRRGWDNKP